jgi:hypothetical protein
MLFVWQGALPEVFTFNELLQLAPRRFAENDVLEALDQSGKAVLVQGCWVTLGEKYKSEVGLTVARNSSRRLVEARTRHGRSRPGSVAISGGTERRLIITSNFRKIS